MISKKASRRNRLKHFVRDGVWASLCDGFAESNFTAFATWLSASASDLGILSSTQCLSSCWLQLWSEKLTCFLGSRKRVVMLCVSLQAFILGLMAIQTFTGQSAYTFMSLSLVFCIFGSFSGSVWTSWVADLLPPGRRGFCFGVRNRFTSPAQFIALLAGGFLLQSIQKKFSLNQGATIAFCVVFLIGLISKLFSLYHLASQPDGRHPLPEISIGPIQLLMGGLRDPFTKRIVIFFGFLGFAVNLAGPFQTPYLLNTLGYGYELFACTTAVLVGARFISAPWIGRFVDQIGYQKPLLVSALFMPCITLGWCISKHWASIMMTQALAGIVWSTFDLAVFCLLAEKSTPITRQRVISMKQLSWNLFSSLGALVGGVFLFYFNNPILLFWSSTFARAIAGFLAFLFFSELIGIRSDLTTVQQKLSP